MKPEYDLVLSGGWLIDPCQNLNGVYEIAIKDGKIARIAESGLAKDAQNLIGIAGRLVIPGMIDTHAHVYQHVTGRFGLDPDQVGVHSGVTTLVDLGGAGLMSLAGFRHYIAEPSASDVYSFISAYVIGAMEGHYYSELYGPDGFDAPALQNAITDNPDLVKGIKAHVELGGISRWGFDLFREVKRVSRSTLVPVYCHLGMMWPLRRGCETKLKHDALLAEVVDEFEETDVLAHPFTKQKGSFVREDGSVNPAIRELVARGVRIDIGRGSNMSYQVARRVLDEGLTPFTIGADLHGYNTRLSKEKPAGDGSTDPVMAALMGEMRFSLSTIMSELYALGIPLVDVVAMVTKNPAELLNMPGKLGTLTPGSTADISVLLDERGDWTFLDSENEALEIERLFYPDFCLKRGVRYEADSLLLPREFLHGC